jgi:hypothetical protein
MKDHQRLIDNGRGGVAAGPSWSVFVTTVLLVKSRRHESDFQGGEC